MKTEEEICAKYKEFALSVEYELKKREETIKVLNNCIKELTEKFYRTREFGCIPLELVKAEAATVVADAVLERAATIQRD